MTALTWDQVGSRLYETGVSKAVLYVSDNNGYAKGVAWNGITGVTETPSGAEPTALYADNIKYVTLTSAEEFGFTIEAYTYPDEFAQCDGSTALATGITVGQQSRKKFALCYRTENGDDAKGNAGGYKIHIIYGAQAAPSERAYSTINDSPEAITFSWEASTTPIPVTGMAPTSLVVIDSRTVDSAILKKIEDKLYGSEAEQPTLLTPDEIKAIN